jgi:hypothetical protein
MLIDFLFLKVNVLYDHWIAGFITVYPLILFHLKITNHFTLCKIYSIKRSITSFQLYLIRLILRVHIHTVVKILARLFGVGVLWVEFAFYYTRKVTAQSAYSMNLKETVATIFFFLEKKLWYFVYILRKV